MPSDELSKNLLGLEQKWKELQKNEQQVLKNIDKLSQMLAKSKLHSKNSYDSVRMWRKEVQKRTFSPQEMQQSQLIDDYDHAFSQLIRSLERLKDSAQLPEGEITWQKIREQDLATLLKRADYDVFADKVNGLLADKPKKLGGKYKNLSKIPVFRITE